MSVHKENLSLSVSLHILGVPHSGGSPFLCIQGSFLGRFMEHSGVLGINPRLTMCKASTLPAVHWLRLSLLLGWWDGTECLGVAVGAGERRLDWGYTQRELV